MEKIMFWLKIAGFVAKNTAGKSPKAGKNDSVKNIDVDVKC